MFLLAASLLQVPASAQTDARAQLRLVVVDDTNSAVPAATVSIYTIDGNPGVTVTADERGVAVFPSLPAGMVQIHARFPGLAPYIDKTRLVGGQNTQTVTLHSKDKVTDTSKPETHSTGS
jgi:hypothetical protein